MIQIPQRLLGEGLLISAKKNPSKIAVIVKDEEYTYGDLAERAGVLAGFFVHSGIQKGDRIAIYMENSWQSILAIYAATLSGAVFLIVNPQTKADKLQYILNDSAAKILITSSLLKREFTQALKDTRNIQHLIVSGDVSPREIPGDIEISSFDEIFLRKFSLPNMPCIIPNDLAALIYTSGSTGFPKGVMMSHQAMVFTSWSLIEYLRLTNDERIMLLLPLAFDYGLYQLIMSITTGSTLIVSQPFIFIASVYESIRKYKPTIFPGVPTMYAMMVASNEADKISFESIRKVTNTAALLPPEYIPALKKIFPNALIFKMYGLTECKRVCYLEPELIDLKPASVGKAIPGTEMFLLSPEGEAVPPGTPGILHVRGPHIMLGYLNQEKLSADMLKKGKLPGEKILCSNDWFSMDEEGFFYFLGRNDDIIKTRGEKVSPVEVENIIYKINGVKEVAVLGIPDDIMGESITAFVTLKQGASLQERDIMKECVRQLESFMVPKKVILLPEMPKSPNGKIDKKVLLKSENK